MGHGVMTVPLTPAAANNIQMCSWSIGSSLVRLSEFTGTGIQGFISDLVCVFCWLVHFYVMGHGRPDLMLNVQKLDRGELVADGWSLGHPVSVFFSNFGFLWSGLVFLLRDSR